MEQSQHVTYVQYSLLNSGEVMNCDAEPASAPDTKSLGVFFFSYFRAKRLFCQVIISFWCRWLARSTFALLWAIALSMTDIYRSNPKYTKAAISNRAVTSGITGLRKPTLLRRKRAENTIFIITLYVSLHFDMRKIFAGIDQKKIVKTGQSLVTDARHIRAITKNPVFIRSGWA